MLDVRLKKMKNRKTYLWIAGLLAGYLLPSIALACFWVVRSGSSVTFLQFLLVVPLVSYAFLWVVGFIPIWIPAVVVGVPFLGGLIAVKKTWGKIAACCALAIHLLCSAIAPLAFYALSGVRGGM
jgi:hypothetical protein